MAGWNGALRVDTPGPRRQHCGRESAFAGD